MVKINDKFSSVLKIDYGVPQGSILDPTLFNLHINDLHNFWPGKKIIQFADDTCVLSSEDLQKESLLDLTKFMKLMNFVFSSFITRPFCSIHSPTWMIRRSTR